MEMDKFETKTHLVVAYQERGHVKEKTRLIENLKLQHHSQSQSDLANSQPRPKLGKSLVETKNQTWKT